MFIDETFIALIILEGTAIIALAKEIIKEKHKKRQQNENNHHTPNNNIHNIQRNIPTHNKKPTTQNNTISMAN